jgi:hypothetical protein
VNGGTVSVNHTGPDAGGVMLAGPVQATGAVTVNAALGDMTVGGGVVTSTAAGDAIVLAGGRFINLTGPGALAVSAGRWLVWSADPGLDTRGGLDFGFKQYAAIQSATPVSGRPDQNGFLYRVAPSVVAELGGSATKIFDGSVRAPSTELRLRAFSGLLDGDTATLVMGPATFDTPEVGVGKMVSAPVVSLTAASAGRAVFGYRLASTSASNRNGVIGNVDAVVRVPDGNSPVPRNSVVATSTEGPCQQSMGRWVTVPASPRISPLAAPTSAPLPMQVAGSDTGRVNMQCDRGVSDGASSASAPAKTR